MVTAEKYKRIKIEQKISSRRGATVTIRNDRPPDPHEPVRCTISVLLFEYYAVLTKLFVSNGPVSLPLMMAGTTLGWSSPMMQYVARGTSPVHLDSAQESWMVTYIDIGNVLLSIPAGILMDRIGRKMSVYLTVPITLAGWILILTARRVRLLFKTRKTFSRGKAIRRETTNFEFRYQQQS